MTDNEIIQALHCCNNGWCDRCPYHGRQDVADCREQSGADLLDLIKRQQAEIEDLNATIHSIITAQADWANNLIRTSLEAFAEMLKEAVIYIPWCEYPPIHREIDNLVKEMVGDESGRL